MIVMRDGQAPDSDDSCRDSKRGGVLDASVAVKWFSTAEASPDAMSVLAWITASQDLRFVVPEIFFAELLSALKRSREDPREVHLALDAVLRRPLRPIRWVECPKTAVINMALGHVGAYDALYAALAIQLQVPLITADRRLYRALGEPDWVRLVA